MTRCKIQTKKQPHGRYANYAINLPPEWVHAVHSEGNTHVEIQVMLDGTLRVRATPNPSKYTTKKRR